eukprot:TRINITY_DN51986_c0_g1_i1.p1 TRINITY_DN51986_c0_g1~~TRINITY_DN51986_c0_g1_i1.p1  ORF type:complete len:120 (+),score=27.58 TRINITY_DN51986_c0_g1_i1:27-386(+)
MFFFFQAEDGIRDAQESRGLGDVYKRQGRINASTRPCALGEGVYFSAKPPRSSSSNLLKNNYGPGSHNSSRVESYVRVDADSLPTVVNGREQLNGRDVFVVPGSVVLSSAGGVVRDRQI